MAVVKKLTLGIRLEIKAFRVESMRGLIIDALLDARGTEIPETYYTNIAEGANGLLSLINEKEGNLLILDRDNIAFTKSAYANGGHIDLDKTFKEFVAVFDVVQRILKLKGVRRIGLVAEHRFDPKKNNNLDLLNALTKLPNRDFPAHFSLHYENRNPPSESVLDLQRGAFTNTIYDFYDSAVDTSVPVEGKINANLDYQRYYAPLLDSKIKEEAEKHFYAFKKELKKFDEENQKFGFGK